MARNQSTGIKPSARAVIKPALSQTAEPDLVELLDGIEHLQVVLARFNPHDTRLVDVSLLTRMALQTISTRINHPASPQSTQNIGTQLQNWENEGGKTRGF